MPAPRRTSPSTGTGTGWRSGRSRSPNASRRPPVVELHCATGFGRCGMNVGDLLRGQYTQGHQLVMGVLTDVPAELVNERPVGATVGSIGSIFAHMVFTEDAFISGFNGTPPLYTRAGWDKRLGVANPGIQQNAEWAAGVKLDLPAFTEYAKDVW